MASLWYRTGTITLTQGSAIVTGAGTTFAANVKTGDMLIGPIMDMYEITHVISDGQLRIDRNYEGASYTGTDWCVAPTAAQLKQLAKQITDLIAIYQDLPQVAVDAQASRDAAAASAASALASKGAATISETNAAASASNALVSANAAAASASAAALSQGQAHDSEVASSASAASALASKTSAARSEGNAAGSATAAAGSASAAAGSAAAAAASAESIAGGPVTSVNGHTGIAVVTAADVGLGDVANKAPADLPVSNATQTALDLKADKTAVASSLALKADLATSIQKTSDTGAAKLPAGTTLQRPAPDEGNLRFNKEAKRYEGGNGTTWGSLGGATGGGNDDAFYENTNTITGVYVGTTGKNASSTGPLKFAEGSAYTVPDGSTWTII
jgi:hypothetical protein